MECIVYYRDWRDGSWTGSQAVKNGLSKDVHRQRLTLFGSNVIDIEGKSTISLLIDEVSLPSNSIPHDCTTAHYSVELIMNDQLSRYLGHPSVLRVPDCQHHLVVAG